MCSKNVMGNDLQNSVKRVCSKSIIIKIFYKIRNCIALDLDAVPAIVLDFYFILFLYIDFSPSFSIDNVGNTTIVVYTLAHVGIEPAWLGSVQLELARYDCELAWLGSLL